MIISRIVWRNYSPFFEREDHGLGQYSNIMDIVVVRIDWRENIKNSGKRRSASNGLQRNDEIMRIESVREATTRKRKFIRLDTRRKKGKSDLSIYQS